MIWGAVVLIALLIPLTAIVLDSPVIRAWAERHHGGSVGAVQEVEALSHRVAELESDLDTVTRQLGQLQDEHQFLQRLLEDPTKRQAAAKGTPEDNAR
jgi:hypothetical protein